MTYNTTGAVHHSGIRNEKELVKLHNGDNRRALNIYLQELVGSQEAPEWEHLGGTGQKADAQATVGGQVFTVSFKNHKDNGTFDWHNTSR